MNVQKSMRRRAEIVINFFSTDREKTPTSKCMHLDTDCAAKFGNTHLLNDASDTKHVS